MPVTIGNPGDLEPPESSGSSGVLTEEQIGQLRQSGIRLDTEGRFIHEGQEVRHAGLRAALWRWLDRNPDGRYVLRLDDQRFVYLEVQGAPHLVRSLRWEGDRAELLLADGSGETLDPASVHIAESGMVYCRVKSGRFEARLASAAWAALGERIVERDGAAWLNADGRQWRIADLTK